MTRKTKQIIIDCVAAAVLLFCGWICVTDRAQAFFHIGQYAYNLIFFCCVTPACIAVTDITEWAHPEYFSDEELKKKGRL